MNNKLSCEIVRDLLPSYVDSLASDATKKAVEEHIEGCSDCAGILQRMREPEPAKAAPAEVDYLKKVRRRTNTKSLLVGIVLMLLGMALLSYRFFYVGSEADASELLCHVSVDGSTVTLSGTPTGSGQAVSRVSFSDSNGMVDFKAYLVPKTFFNSGEFVKSYTAASPVGQVRSDGLIVWENGTEISSVASRLFAAANPFVGDMPSNGRIAAILGVSEQFGPYTNELQTEKEPYDWRLNLQTPIAADEESAARDIMAADSYAMLAVIGNLGSVTWQYSTEEGQREYAVTQEAASRFAGGDIKEAASSASGLQELLQSLSFKWAGVREVLQEDGSFRLSIRNYSSEDIYELGISYYLDGELVGSGGQINADGSPFKSEEEVTFEFTPENFPRGTTAIALNGFSFSLSATDRDGNETVVCESMAVPAKYAWTFFYSLSGSFAEGFVLNAG